MKIVHFCLSCFYIDGYRYQENELVRQHVENGHDVTVIASTETYIDNMTLGYISPSTYIGSDGAKVIRLPYAGPFPHVIKRKIRAHPKVMDLLNSIRPDVIMFHGLCGWELRTVTKYKRLNPQVKLYLDSHEDANNSATGFLSRNILHRLFYKPLIAASLSSVDKILCVSLETINFCKEFYDIPMQMLEFYPLGGNLLTDEEYDYVRTSTRLNLNLKTDDIVFVQSGKFDSKKRLDESLIAFSLLKNRHFRFLIVGNVLEGGGAKSMELINADARISYLGWQSSDNLYRILCAADVYVQPGSQSATMQMSLCTRCAVILADTPSHSPFVNGNGWVVNDFDSICAAFSQVEFNSTKLESMANCSKEIATNLLDYRVLADRLLK